MEWHDQGIGAVGQNHGYSGGLLCTIGRVSSRVGEGGGAYLQSTGSLLGSRSTFLPVKGAGQVCIGSDDRLAHRAGDAVRRAVISEEVRRLHAGYVAATACMQAGYVAAAACMHAGV